jgi:hypothetical protein
MAQGPTDSPDDDRAAALLAALLQQNPGLLAEIKRLLARIAEVRAAPQNTGQLLAAAIARA